MKEHSEPSKTDNELIAEFMGIERDKHSRLYDSQSKLTFDRCPNAPYDTSWDWLMPVVEAIEGLEEPASADPTKGTIWPYQVEIIGRNVVEIYNSQTSEAIISINNPKGKLTKIESVYQAVVEFIKWYNSQQHERK